MSDELYSFLTLPTGDDKITIEQVATARFKVHSQRELVGEYSSISEAMRIASAYLLGRGRYDAEFVRNATSMNAYEVETFDPSNIGDEP